MEVSGLALGVMPSLMQAMKMYANLLDGIRNAGAQRATYRMRILVQRARFETWIQQVSNMDMGNDKDIGALMNQLAEQVKHHLSRLSHIFDTGYDLIKRPSQTAEKFRWALMDRAQLNKAVQDLKECNDDLWSLLELLERKQKPTLPADDIPLSTKLAISPGPVGANNSSARSETTAVVLYEMISRASPSNDIPSKTDASAQTGSSGAPVENLSLAPSPKIYYESVFRATASACERALKLILISSKNFHETYLSYRLWMSTMVTENIFDFFEQPWRVVAGGEAPRNIHDTHIRILVHLTRTLIQAASTFEFSNIPKGQDALSELHSSLSLTGHREIDSSNVFDLGTFEVSKSPREAFLEEIELIVDILLDSLPSLLQVKEILLPVDQALSKSRALVVSSVTESERVAAIRQLLEDSINMITSISIEMDHQISLQKIDIATKALFEKEALILRKWKEQNEPKIVPQVISKSPAKIEALAESTFNVAHILRNIPGLLGFREAGEEDAVSNTDKLLAEYPSMFPQLELKSKSEQVNDQGELFDDFKACVETFQELEVSMDLIAPPPTYNKSLADRVLMDMEGRVTFAE